MVSVSLPIEWLVHQMSSGSMLRRSNWQLRARGAPISCIYPNALWVLLLKLLCSVGVPQFGLLVSQAAINAEKERLAGVRVREDSTLAQEAAQISGQQVPGIASLEELLRRPHVHYR